MKIDIDSPLMNFMQQTAQYALLNIIFLITCIPIVTIGPAVAALYQVLLREVRGEHGYIIKKYFQHFKEMLRQGILTFMLLGALLLIVVFAAIFWGSLDGAAATAVTVILAILAVVVLSAMIIVFPLMARFQNTFRQTIKNAFLIALVNLRTTLILLALHITFAALIWLFTPVRILTVLIGCSFFAYCCSYIYTRLFKIYEPAEHVQAEIQTE